MLVAQAPAANAMGDRVLEGIMDTSRASKDVTTRPVFRCFKWRAAAYFGLSKRRVAVSRPVQIHVSLLDEAVEVWRPVFAEDLGGDVYRIAEQPYDRDLEIWQFEPGDVVVCRRVDSSEGRILAATKKATELG
ncbi:MAG: hypothetical protein KDB53_07790 [Planctomycetes bacterium]|nr:hypothetical protein [Planctomycetota bacterium]